MCTRVFWADNEIAKVCGRTFDWEICDDALLWTLPRGMARDGGAGAGSLEWVSRHGSVAASIWGVGTTDALNEQGLGVHLLYLRETAYEPVDDRPGVSNLRWVQWIADNFATVDEAVAAMDDVRIVDAEVRGQHFGVHLAIEDASGDSAIVEIIDGKKVVHHGRGTTVMANDPPYDQQIELLSHYRGFGGELPPPGDILSRDRFVRTSYFLQYLPAPSSYQEAVAGVVSLARNAAVPAGAPYDDFSVYPTWWISATDVTSRTYYFQPTTSPNLIWLELDALDLAEGAPTRCIDPYRLDLVGDVASRLEPAPALF